MKSAFYHKQRISLHRLLRFTSLSCHCHLNLEPARMARVMSRIICFLIMFMDIAAGILGIEAAIAQNKGKYLRVMIFECKAPVHQAYKLGLAAAMLLALAHAITNLLGGCTCICSREEFEGASADKQMATATLVLSWIILAVAFTLLMMGAVSNSQSRRSCGFPHHHFLIVGGILCFVHGLFCVAYYVSSVEEKRKRKSEEGHQVHV